MNTMPNPHSFRIRRTPRLALAAAVALLLALALLSVAMPPRPAEAILPGGWQSPPKLTVSKSSVVVNEGQTATNGGSFDDSADFDDDSVSVSASVGTVSQSGTYNKGTWSWSHETSNVSDDTTTQVKITAKDSTGRSSSKYFSLKVLDLDPYPMNDMFANATPIDLSTSGQKLGNTRLATTEPGEPTDRYSSSGEDCGMFGRKHTVWFKLTFPSGQHFRFETYGSNFDTVLALYKVDSMGTRNQVACSNNNPRSSSGDWTDELTEYGFQAAAGSTYYLQLSGTGGAPSGKYKLSWYRPIT